MRFIQFSKRQLILSVIWICVGLSGFAISAHPWRLSLRQSDDRAHAIQQVVRTGALAVGLVSTCVAIVPLVTTRPLAIVLVLMLFGFISGAFAGSTIAHVVDPTFNYKGASDEQRQLKSVITWSGGAAGAVLLPLLAEVVVGLTSTAKKNSRRLKPDHSSPPPLV